MRFVRIFAGFTAEGRRTAVEPLKLVIVHIMQHQYSDILRHVAVCNIYYYALSGFLMIRRHMIVLESI